MSGTIPQGLDYVCAVPDTNGTVIILEPDAQLAESLASAVKDVTGLVPCVTAKATDGLELIVDNPDAIFAAVVGVGVTGANTLLEALEQQSIPSVAFGADMTNETRRSISTLSITDTILGEQASIPARVADAVDRLKRNANTTILVADDSRSMRMAINRYLTTRRYLVLMARDGEEALHLIKKHPEIKVVITDNEMPNMDGYSLVREIRKTHSKEELAVIGISAMNNSMLSVDFINKGANDFLKKPFVKEELYCRVDHNIDMLERIALIRDLSNKDPLTKLYNRRYFYDNSEEFLTLAQEDCKRVVASMIDIDFFKKFNDTYGHDMGDAVLVHVSNLIGEAFAKDAIVSRFGGEEFCVLSAHSPGEDIFAQYDLLRRSIENASLTRDGKTVQVTVSIGVCVDPGELEAMINKADANLYASKQSGRNRVTLT